MVAQRKPRKSSPKQKGVIATVAHDFASFRLAVAAVGLTVLMTGGGITVLTMLERQIPTALIALGSNALGMLGGLLVPRPPFSHH